MIQQLLTHYTQRHMHMYHAWYICACVVHQAWSKGRLLSTELRWKYSLSHQNCLWVGLGSMSLSFGVFILMELKSISVFYILFHSSVPATFFRQCEHTEVQGSEESPPGTSLCL
jgi:hypothetical protein